MTPGLAVLILLVHMPKKAKLGPVELELKEPLRIKTAGLRIWDCC
jgi:hypothetical protein